MSFFRDAIDWIDARTKKALGWVRRRQLRDAQERKIDRAAEREARDGRS